MGHRRHSQPRRGSLAYSPRGRAKKTAARVRTWPGDGGGAPRMLAHVGFKAGCLQIVSTDDRENAPNHGRQLVSLGTVLATPPVHVVGLRVYRRDSGGLHAALDAYAPDLPREITKRVSLSSRHTAESLAAFPPARVARVAALVAAVPRAAGLEQKTPHIFEAPITGGGPAEQLEYAVSQLGRQVRVGDVFEEGSGVDVAAVTKGKGWQGVIARFGAKKKQHKSRKTVRELGSLGPISPQYVMYTVPRAGQTGFHQRVEYNKRIMAMGSAEGGGDAINPAGGYKHFGLVRGDYVVLKGSVPGTYKRMVKLRARARGGGGRARKPAVRELVVAGGRGSG